jgi:hypothetical protein
MSFGMCNAAQTFERFMNNILQELDFYFAYFDDIPFLCQSLEEY